MISRDLAQLDFSAFTFFPKAQNNNAAMFGIEKHIRTVVIIRHPDLAMASEIGEIELIEMKKRKFKAYKIIIIR